MRPISSVSRLSLLIVPIAMALLFSVICASTVNAQKRVKLKQADVLRSGIDKEGTKFQRVIGNVIFAQNKTTIYCDSAYFYKTNNAVEAFGRIRITEGDSVTITGRKLEYDGNTKKAKLRNDVVFTKLATSTLYTDFLDYDRPANKANYFNGGKLVDSINVLVSNKGWYNLTNNMASFKKDVHVKNPDYTMTSDSLEYNSKTKVIFFRTPTTVVNNDSSVFVYNGGQHNTSTKRAELEEGKGESLDYRIRSQAYQLDGIRKIYKLRGDVVMTSKKENLIIYGQATDYYKTLGISKVYNHAYAAKITDNSDTLFISADTLVSVENVDPTKKRLLAYHNVRIFKNDLQGIADSLEYRESDSTIYMYRGPVLWTEGNQMTADSIHMLLKNKTIEKIFMNVNSFVISQDSLLNFNQIKGRKMTAEFKDSQINRVFVEGNGESLYFMLKEKEEGAVGMNKIICSKILIRFKQGKLNNMSFYVQPDASFIPPHEIKKEDLTLKGFVWKPDKKPTRSGVIR
ncbi:MAG: OstA-like protein [Chryseolinea sp.]